MEGAALETNTAPDVSVKPANMACLRRQAWANSKESTWQESGPRSPTEPQKSQSTSDPQRPSEEPGQNPNKIASWLIECSTPFGASLDDQSPPPNKGVLRNGCSFEDDLSLGAEANHLLSNNNKTEPRFNLVADQKRSQYKERGRSMNSTGSGKSSTVSSVSELLDLYEEDPEEILFNLGFGREEPDLNAKIPSRFFNSSSVARGIDIKVYLKAQLQRMELENPNYALTSRFRQIEVLTTVANEFFQLYSQVSGQPVQRISSKDQDSEGGDEGRSEEKPPLKKTNSALNVAKLLKKTISKHNLLAASPESPAQTNGCTAAVSNHAAENGITPAGSEREGEAADSDHKVEAGGQKLVRKKDNCSLATVTEESGGDGEPDLPSDDGPEQSTRAEHQVDLVEFQTLSQTSGLGGAQVDQPTSTLEKGPRSLTPPHLAQLRIENTDSFDMEEIQSNDDETLPPRTSRAADLLRTVSQQSDSSGFAEEPSADSGSSLKVQESSDSCDSETTVTSHPSQDLATPVALDQPGFVLPEARQGEVGSHEAAEVDGRSNSVDEDQMKLSPVQFPQYTVHQLPKLIPVEEQQDESLDEEGELKAQSMVSQCVSAAEEETLQESEEPGSQSVSEQNPQPTGKLSEIVADITPSTDRDHKENGDLQESLFLDNYDQLCPTTPSYRVLSALNRAKQSQLSRMGSQIEPEINEMPPSPERGRSQRSTIRLQRSSSLPSSLLSPSKMVSSIKIQVGRGQGSCSQTRFSVKYTQEDGQEQEVEQEKSTNVLSTLIINPAPLSACNKKTPTAIPPKPIPSHLMRSCRSLQSSSPPPEWSPEEQIRSTQSVPDLSDQHPSNQNLNSWSQNFPTLPSQYHSAQHIAPCSSQYASPGPSTRFNFSPYAFPQHTQPLHHSQSYSSLPNLVHHQNPSMVPHRSGSTGHYTHATPLPPQHQNMSTLHQASNPMLPYHVGPGHPHPGNPMMQSHGYNHPYTSSSPYNATPLGAQCSPQHLSYQGYVNSFSHPVSQYPPPPPPPPPPQHLTLEPSIYPGLAPLAPSFHPGHGSAYHQGYNFYSGFVNPPGVTSRPGLCLSSTEIQLRRVLHEIRGTIQSLIEDRVHSPDVFSEHRAAHPSFQSLSEFQQKRRSLNLFRRQMMDLEASIMQQQSLVYNHLSPADRIEMEKLQSLRSSVREELQELEQQLEEKLMDLMKSTQRRDSQSNSSIDNFSTMSALRAMEPMSELLSEQFYLQSELNYDSHESSTYPFSRSSSPLRGKGAGGDSKQKQELYRTSVDITPSIPSRPNTRSKGRRQEMEEAEESDCVGVEEEAEGKGDASEKEEEDGATGEVRLDNLQQLIKEIRESVAQEVRKEIYSELLAAVTMQQSPVSARKHHP